MNQNEQQDFLLSTFREEIDGHMVNLTRGLVEIEEGGEEATQTERFQELMRLLHTVKGASRMMGFADISKVAHAMEDVVGHFRENKASTFPRQVTDLLFDGIDAISEMVRRSTNRADAPTLASNPLISPENLAGLIFKLGQQAEKTVSIEELLKTLSSPGSSNGHKAEILAAQPNEPVSNWATSAETVVSNTEPTVERNADETIRVRLDKLDNLINLAGELVISKIQNEEHLKAVQDILQLSRQRSRIAVQLRDFLIEQTPIEERSRLLGLTELFSFEQAELPGWVASLPVQDDSAKAGSGRTALVESSGLDARMTRKIFNQLEAMINLGDELEKKLTKAVRERKNYNLRFDTAADELRRNMLGIRMLPLDTIFGRFARPIRDLANERGKQVRLVVSGGAIEVDKRILEEIADPLMHILRNAVDHGIEEPENRLTLNKSVEGTIHLSAMQKGSHVLIQVQDDGAGISPEQLRATAATKGVMSKSDAAGLSDEAALDLIFRPGFSTRASPDEISGRGIGMDVVQQNIKKLNGRVAIQTNRGVNTIFTMEIPLTLATVDALLVRAGGQLFAMPSVMVSSTLRMGRETIQKVEGREVLRLRGQFVPLVKLSELLALSVEEDNYTDPQIFNAVLISAGIGGASDNGKVNVERFICFEVDELVDEREVVVKALGSFIEKTPNIAGASVLGAEGLALILDVFGLVQSVRQGSSVTYKPPAATTKLFMSKRTRRILVVDDSLATRELERSILETAGYTVVTARDGVEGLKMLREQKPDLVLTDIEMPNMDGFRFCAAIKQDEQLKNLPVIVVSSRDSDEDRRKGLQAGAQAYIVKGQFEQTSLLDTISRLVV